MRKGSEAPCSQLFFAVEKVRQNELNNKFAMYIMGPGAFKSTKT
jgi:hypothetical protein